ncbi:hypothetical protein KCP74_14945 [Salmonella enterica subsp. enterica]|nr:hypothetical protein KCP74_14945 [Salmonella enterica subsp. enterica]
MAACIKRSRNDPERRSHLLHARVEILKVNTSEIRMRRVVSRPAQRTVFAMAPSLIDMAI